jgi:ankyrin repeat protein
MNKFNPLLLSKMEVFKYNKLLTACEEKNEKEAMQIIENIYKNEESVNIIESVFCCACYDGKLDIVTFILQVDPSINISSKNEYAFRIALIKNHIDICKFLLNFKPEINLNLFIGIIYEKFWEFCTIGHKDNAEWLFYLCPTIDKFVNHCLYIIVCANNHIHVAKWLTILKPYYFILELNNDETKILHYSIRDIKERKWLERRIPILAHNDIKNDFNIFKSLPYDIIRYICLYI